MKTTPTDRAAWRGELTRVHPDMRAGDAKIALAVLDDLVECEARCAALQAESDAHTKWLNEVWPTQEDAVLGELVRERDEARTRLAALRLAATTALDLAERRRHGVWIPSSAVAALLDELKR